MKNAGLDEAQAGIKIAGRNINNLIHIFRWHHLYGRKWRGTKKSLDEGESGEWKSGLKAEHSGNKDHGIEKRGMRDQIANIRWIMEKAKEFQKNTDFFIN